MTLEDVQRANRRLGYVRELEGSEAFRTLFQTQFEEAYRDHLTKGTDPQLTPQERAEHHRAMRLAGKYRDLLQAVRIESEKALKKWADQNR